MLFCNHQRTAKADDLFIEISNTRLERISKFKYLGVLLDNALSWKDHAEHIGSSQTNLLSTLQYFSPSIFRLLFACLGQLWGWEQSLSR